MKTAFLETTRDMFLTSTVYKSSMTQTKRCPNVPSTSINFPPMDVMATFVNWVPGIFVTNCKVLAAIFFLNGRGPAVVFHSHCPSVFWAFRMYVWSLPVSQTNSIYFILLLVSLR